MVMFNNKHGGQMPHLLKKVKYFVYFIVID